MTKGSAATQPVGDRVGTFGPIVALFVATFCIATTELAIVGILPEIAHDFKIGIPKAGILVSGYAAGVAIGSPILTILFMSLERKVTLLLLMAIFVSGHVLSATAPTYAWLMFARILAAVCHASFLGIAAVVAAHSVAENRSARAVSMVWLGFSASSLIGVPGSAAIGHLFGWRATFWAITAVGVIATLGIAIFIPRQAKGQQSNLATEIRALGRPQVLLAMTMSLLVCASTFSVFTYIAPLLSLETRISEQAIPVMLFLFGVGGTIGLLAAGYVDDRRQLPIVVAMFAGQALVFLLLVFTIHSVVLTGITMAVWGFLFLAPCVPLQTRVVKESKDGPNLASTLNQSAFNVGNALGPFAGAAVLSAGVGYVWLPWVGGVVSILGIAVASLAIRLAAAPWHAEEHKLDNVAPIDLEPPA
ncbi:DHA1 family inner membrane transport protein [Mesorhizobium sp. USDA 4775]